MNTKLKLLLVALAVVCLISIVFNIVLCSKSDTTNNVGETPDYTVYRADSIRTIQHKDSIIDDLSKQINEMRSNMVGNASDAEKLNSQISELEKSQKNANTRISALEQENKTYLDEIHRLIKEIDYAVNNTRPAKRIKIDPKYREKQ